MNNTFTKIDDLKYKCNACGKYVYLSKKELEELVNHHIYCGGRLEFEKRMTDAIEKLTLNDILKIQLITLS